MPANPALPMGLTRPLTADERRAVEERLADVELKLATRDRTAIERAVTAMMVSFPSSRASGDEAKVVVGAYVLVLNDLPPWAVEQTVREWMRGEGSAANLAFQPSAAELHKAAAAKVTPHQRATAELRGLLLGKPREEHPAFKSRERANPKDLMREAAFARLDARAKDMGLDASVLDTIPNAPPRHGDMDRPAFDLGKRSG